MADKFHVPRLVQPAAYRYLKHLEFGRAALPLWAYGNKRFLNYRLRVLSSCA